MRLLDYMGSHHMKLMCETSMKGLDSAYTLQQIEVVQLVAVLHDVALDLGGVHPSHEIFHISTSWSVYTKRVQWRQQSYRVTRKALSV